MNPCHLGALIRAIPTDNPRFAADLMLNAAEALDAAARAIEAGHPCIHPSLAGPMARDYRALAERTRALAPLWATPLPLHHAADLLRREPAR